MAVTRMDNVLIVVDDLEATKAFFVELGLTLEGEQTVEGPLVGKLIGLEDVRRSLVEDKFEITVEPDIVAGARRSLDRMLAVPRDN